MIILKKGDKFKIYGSINFLSLTVKLRAVYGFTLMSTDFMIIYLHRRLLSEVTLATLKYIKDEFPQWGFWLKSCLLKVLKKSGRKRSSIRKVKMRNAFLIYDSSLTDQITIPFPYPQTGMK